MIDAISAARESERCAGELLLEAAAALRDAAAPGHADAARLLRLADSAAALGHECHLGSRSERIHDATERTN